MAEQIYTIPINEAFDLNDGCPVCRLHRDLERQSLEYIMGAAMMEPDIRIVTNRTGFCRQHFHDMLGMGNRLSLALMLESHLDSVAQLLPEPGEKKAGKLGRLRKYDGTSPADDILSQVRSCYVCSRVNDFLGKYISNIVYIWKKDPEFREKLARQNTLCLYHAGLLLSTAQKELNESAYLQFSDCLLTLLRAQLQSLRADVHTFTRSFDHENAGKPLSDAARYSVEHTVDYLSGL